MFTVFVVGTFLIGVLIVILLSVMTKHAQGTRNYQLQIAESISQIAESKRLSTILTIEGKKDLDIKPEEFEANKEEIRKRMHEVMEEVRPRYEKGKNDPDTWAYVILDHSGFNAFVDSDARSNAKKALARLLANGNITAAKQFLTTLARNL